MIMGHGKAHLQISAEYLPGKKNVQADYLSRVLSVNIEWSLDRQVFLKMSDQINFEMEVEFAIQA